MAGNILEYVTPLVQQQADLVTINILSPECLGPELQFITEDLASGAFTANLAVYVPLLLARPVIVSQFFWRNGTVVGGNTDVGIYNADGSTKLTSTGSTANSGTSAIQVVDISNVTLPANARLWLALSSDSGTQTYFRNTASVSAQDFAGVKQQASAWSSGLPTTATFAAPTVAHLPWFGFTGSAVI